MEKVLIVGGFFVSLFDDNKVINKKDKNKKDKYYGDNE